MKPNVKLVIALLLIISTICYLNIGVLADNSGGAANVSSSVPDKMKLVAENQYLMLYMDFDTTEIAVKDKRTGAVFYSNPPDRQSDSIANAENKMRLGSQLALSYYNSKGQPGSMDNANDCIKANQFTISEIENGVKVLYDIGIKKIDINSLPKVISKERFESLILSKVEDEEDRQFLLTKYQLVSLNDAKSEEEKQNLINTYVNIKNTDLYVLDKYIYVYEIPAVYRILAEAGYTQEDLIFDNTENEIIAEVVLTPKFIIPIEYTLEGENLIVRIPCSEIHYEREFPLTTVRVLEYFGAAKMSDNGYIFIPDGSGALINLNNPNKVGMSYKAPVYGFDSSIRQKEKVQIAYQAYLPVFGLKKDNSAFFAIIEEGDAMASIGASIGGVLNSYSSVYSEFTVLPWTEVSFGRETEVDKIKVYQKRPYQKDIVIRFAFLHGEKAGYIGMAEYYRNYLIEKGMLGKKIEPKSNIPFNLELIGAIYRHKSILGIPRKVLEPLTTFEQASQIITELSEDGIDNINLKFSGWFNGGIDHVFPTNINIEGKLGGKKGFNKLVDTIKTLDGKFYPDVSFMYMYRVPFLFSIKENSARYLSKDSVKLKNFNIANFQPVRGEEGWYLLSPSKLDYYVSNFINKYKNYGIGNISLRVMGEVLYSDFNERNLVDRQEAKEIVMQQGEKFQRNGINLMVNGCNAYMLPYVDNIVNMPLTDSKFIIADESIPFYQIVVHGFIEYSGEPVNLAGDYIENILKTVETGACLYFTWIHAESSILKDTAYRDLYSVNYKDWYDIAIDLYEKINLALRDVQDQMIIGHEKIGDKVYRTIYENGKEIVVNYGDKPFYTKGIKIDGKSFEVVAEGGK
ncbi:MAG TPA: hypothetical protein GXX37_10385 [Clostridiaceae bacterium]|nr:hypothetical protein [Clostridiaceae bacterium]